MSYPDKSSIEETPYSVEQRGEGKVIIRLVEYCNTYRKLSHERQLTELVDSNSLVVCDASKNKMVSSDWLRWFARMTLKAHKLGKKFVMVGVSEDFRDIADMLALEDKFIYAETVDSALGETSFRIRLLPPMR